MSTQILLFILAALMAAVCVFFLVRIASISRRKRAGEYWPVTTATVTRREVKSSRNTQTHSNTYRAEITFSYQAPGGPYEKNLSLGAKGLRDQAEKLFEQIGDSIQVHYNPEKPQDQITEYEKIQASDVFAAIGTLVLAVVLFILAM